MVIGTARLIPLLGAAIVGGINGLVLALNVAAVDPVLTNEKCSFWHFRFDAHADMRMAALMEVMREDKALKSVHLIGQDYSFGQAVLREAKKQLAAQRPDVAVVGVPRV